jgi:hypothetical protein
MNSLPSQILERCMQLFMKPLTFSTIILLTLSACGQTPNSSKGVSHTSSVSKDTTTIYRNISLETCNCTFSTMKNNKPSTSMDSCYQAVLLKYNDSLKQLGFDPATQVGQLKLSNEVVGKLYRNCPDLSKLIQTKLRSGLYQIVMKNVKSNQTKTFYAKNPFDETQIKKYEPGYELTVEYEIVKNNSTNKEEYHLKEFGTVSSVGAVKATNQ